MFYQQLLLVLLFFSASKLNIHFGANSFGHGYRSDGFTKLDLDYFVSFFFFLILLLIRFLNLLNSLIVLDTYKERMNRLAKEELLGPLNNIRVLILDPCLARKANRKLFGKTLRGFTSEAQFILTFLDL